MPFTISPATAADLPAVVDLSLLVEAQHEAYNAVRWKTRTNLRKGYLGWLSRNLDNPDMLVLAAKTGEGKVVGALLAAIEDEIPIYTYSQYAFVHDLAVDPAYRRQGVARAMMARAREWATERGMNQLRLMVAAQNPEAETLFRSLGFETTYHEMILPMGSGPPTGRKRRRTR